MPTPPAGSTLGRVAVWLLTLLVGVAAIEGTARIEDWVQYGVPVSSPFNATSQLVTRSADGMHGRRSAAFQKWRMNSLGFRGPEADSAPTPGRVRVIAVGASETFGLYESLDQEWPRQLEDSLAARLAGTGCAPNGVEVWNGAFAGMTLPTIVQDVRQRLVRFRPDVVVAYPTPAFYLLARRPQAAAPDSSPQRVPAGLRIWPRLRDQLKELVPEPLATLLRRRMINRVRSAAPVTFASIPTERVMWYGEDLATLVTAVRDIGAIPVLATHANAFGFGTARPVDSSKLTAWQRFHPLATGATLIAFDSAARAATLSLGDSLRVPVSDVAAALAAQTEPVFADYAHFNDTGAGIVAGEIATAVASVLTGRCH